MSMAATANGANGSATVIDPGVKLLAERLASLSDRSDWPVEPYGSLQTDDVVAWLLDQTVDVYELVQGWVDVATGEIANGRALLADMQAATKQRQHDPHAPRLVDAFGHERHLQLGIPSGHNSHRLLDVSPDLAVSVIEQHIANMQAELVKLSDQARLELDVLTPVSH